MSGGHFNYSQHRIQDIIESIESMIANNKIEDDWGYCPDYSEEKLERFREAIPILKKAYIYAQRIDWLVSGDDGEDSFHNRLENELAGLEGDSLGLREK